MSAEIKTWPGIEKVKKLLSVEEFYVGVYPYVSEKRFKKLTPEKRIELFGRQPLVSEVKENYKNGPNIKSVRMIPIAYDPDTGERIPNWCTIVVSLKENF